MIGIMINIGTDILRVGRSALSRLRSARLSLTGTALLLIIIVYLQPELIWICIVGYVVIFALTYLTSRSRNVRHIRNIAAHQRKRIWPRNAMKAVAQSINNPVFIIDRQGILRFANTASEDVFGTASLGDPVSFKFREPAIINLVEKATQTDERQWDTYDEQIQPKRRFQIECVPVPKLQKIDGSTLPSKFFLLVFTDVTQFMQLDQMRSDFVANASHELRTPLASLRGYIETLQGAAKNDEKAREKFLQVMLNQAERMSRLIDDLLSLSRVEMNAHMVPEDNVDLASILLQLNDVLEPTAVEYQQTFKFSGFETPVMIKGDRDELTQLFSNLIENACRYGHKGGTVRIGLNKNGNITVEVADNGIGIASAHIPRLTERFFRAQNNNSPATKGTGLGLAIVKHIVNRHQATLDISSELGKGTIVRVTFAE